MLISSSPSFGESSDIPNLDKAQLNPAGSICFDGREIKQIASFKKECELNELNMKTYQEQYEKCRSKDLCKKSYLDSEAVFWGSVLAALGGGFLLGKMKE